MVLKLGHFKCSDLSLNTVDLYSPNAYSVVIGMAHLMENVADLHTHTHAFYKLSITK